MLPFIFHRIKLLILMMRVVAFRFVAVVNFRTRCGKFLRLFRHSDC